MKEMKLIEIQRFGLNILKDVHDFCVSNNIRYSLGYGTLIGAIRHKGFIPWDDDIDIIMPRPDYERFCKTYKSKVGLAVFSPVNGDSYLNYARVCDLNKTYVHSLAWCIQSPTGIWIDIFPIEGINPEEICDKEWLYLRNLHRKKMKARIPMENLLRPMPMKRRLKSIGKKILYFWTDIKGLVEEYENYITRIGFDNSNDCGMRSITNYYWRENYPKSYFDSYVDVEFEGIKFKAIAEYDNYLRTIYGDYMELPPEEKRVRHPQKMYWI